MTIKTPKSLKELYEALEIESNGSVVTDVHNINFRNRVSVTDDDDGTITLDADQQDHGELNGLSDDDHDQYLPRNGSRKMQGNLDMGTLNVTNVTEVDGIDVDGHDHSGGVKGIAVSHQQLTNVNSDDHHVQTTSGDIDHGSVNGLSDDDHTQYTHIDGRRAMTGNFDLGTNSIINGSSITLNNAGVIDTDIDISGIGSALTGRGYYLPWDSDFAFLGLVDRGSDNKPLVLANEQNSDDFEFVSAGQVFLRFPPDNPAGHGISISDADKLEVDETLLDHGDIGGLGDDDHSQYLLVDGSRNMNGFLNMGGNGIENITSEKAIEFDNGEAMITIHDGHGNFNILSGIDSNNTIVTDPGGTRLQLYDNGVFDMEIYNGNVGDVGTMVTSLQVDSDGGHINNEFIVNDRVYIDNHGFGGTPSIALAIGDSDTGIHSDSDGRLEFWSNNDENLFLSNELFQMVNTDINVDGNYIEKTNRVGVSDTSSNDKFDIEYNSDTNSLDFNYVGG